MGRADCTARSSDTALAWAVINHHFDVADFLLEHGADINTNWNSHEPASILHHLVFLPNSYESMRFLIDRGIDMNIKDYRWNGHCTWLGTLRREGREDGSVAGRRATAAGIKAMNKQQKQSTYLRRSSVSRTLPSRRCRAPALTS